MGILSKIFNMNVKSDSDTTNLNENIKLSSNVNNSNFFMVAEDIFYIRGQGTVVTGYISKGEIHVGDTVTINNNFTCTVTRIEQFRKVKEYAMTGENVGLILNNTSNNKIYKGDTITK